MNARKMDTHAIVSSAREAAQMAEDARTIAVKRRDEERHRQEIKQSENQGELRRQAEEDQARERADAEADAEAAAQQAERVRAQAAAAAQDRAVQQSARLAPPPPPPLQPVVRTLNSDAAQRQFRSQLLAQLNGTLSTRDTPRGLVVTVTDSMFESGNDTLRSDADQRLRNIAAVVSSHPGLSIRVEGYADVEGLSQARAESVRAALIARGSSPDAITAAGFGNARPIASNATAAGREQNRRVEVVISGPSIGNKALWDKPYSLRSQR
jgi:outer membrane protein OmpA-like peptidoglycan-associated protein